MRLLAPVVIILAAAASACGSTPAPEQTSSSAVAPSPPPTSSTRTASSDALNGIYTVTVDNGKHTVNGLTTPTPNETSAWTITSTCEGDTCSGQVSSDQGWTAPATMSHDRWTVTYDKPAAVTCADGTSVPATLAYSFDGRVLNGIFTSVTKPGSCGPGQIVGQAPWTLVKKP